MAKRVISGVLSATSIEQMRDELLRYQQSLKNKNELFVRRLAEIGIPVIDRNIASTKGDSKKSHNTYIKINSFGEYSQAVLVCEGKDLLFIEFGAGIHYNGNPGESNHPKGEEMGYTIGSYGKGLGKNDYWVYYTDDGRFLTSHGTEATMPVYKAGQEIIKRIREIAKEVFGG